MEITKKNFDEHRDDIVKDLKCSSFVGFDAEFTAILSRECFKHRLFDTCEDRYDKIKNEVSKMIMTQIGLTMFKYDRELDSYIATGYTFHLCPQVAGDLDQSFIFQASTLKFLCRHNFDFNKFIYEGLPYLSKAEEAQIRQHIKDNTLFNNLSRSLEFGDEKKLQHHCSEVSKWLSTNEGDTMYIDVQDPVLRYLIHNELRIRFPNILTTNSLGNSNKVLIYRDKNVDGATSAPIAMLEDNLMHHLLGFSQVITLLEKYGKPIVGHNLFLDAILLHNQFIGPLPSKYATFKKNINKMFPKIFDTKYISREMGKKLTLDEVWKSNALQDLYEFFSEGKCKRLSTGMDFIKLRTPFNAKQSYHEAGWDSYCTGYCFLRLGQWAASENRGKNRPVGPTELLATLNPLCNRVNVIRAAVSHMSFVENDPERHRPELLHVKSLRERVINVGKLASILASFGQVDIKRYGSRTALIAANTQFTVDKILKNFKDNKEYSFSKYNIYRHSTAGRIGMWGGALITGSIMLYLIHRKIKYVA